jgi:hypothetical protein
MPPRPETCFSGSTIGHITTTDSAIDWYGIGGTTWKIPEQLYYTPGVKSHVTFYFLNAQVLSCHCNEMLMYKGWKLLWYFHARYKCSLHRIECHN